jgi:DNA-binding transcriptional MerR regulator
MKDEMQPVPDLMTIGELSRLTGVNSVTLRAWERRHGLLQPERNQQGHRYYRQGHFEEVQEILKWLDRGYAISKLSPVLLRKTQVAKRDREGDIWCACQEQLQRAASALNQNQLDHVINELVANYPIDLCADRVLAPWLNQWIRDEHAGLRSGIVVQFALNFLRMRLHHRLFQLERGGRSEVKAIVVFGSLSAPRYDAHFYLFANVLADFHYRVVPMHVLGALADLSRQVAACDADAMILFANNSLDPVEVDTLQRNVKKLAVPVSIFGDAVQMQHGNFAKLSIDVLTDTGSAAIKSWIMRQGASL